MPFDRSSDVRAEVIGIDGARQVVFEGARIGSVARGGWLDNSKVIFGANNIGPSIWWQLWNVDTAEGTVLGVGELGTQGSVSPDNSTLVFPSKDELYAVRNIADIAVGPWPSNPAQHDWDTTAEPLPSAGGGQIYLTTSPDSSSLLYTPTTGSTPTGATVLNLNDESVINLVPNEMLSAGEAHGGVGAWSPDSSAAIVELSGVNGSDARTNSVFTLDGARIDLGVEGRAFAWTSETATPIGPATCQAPTGS